MEMAAGFGRPLETETGEHLFRQGERCGEFFVVREGLLKGYYLSQDGKENIKSFLLPGDTIGSLSAMRGNGVCSFGLVCLSPCKLTAIRFDDVTQAASRDAKLGTAIAEFLIAFGMKKEQREYELLCLSAEERYRRLSKNRPELLELVQQSDIALYLGVTPVGLSRIKKRVENRD